MLDKLLDKLRTLLSKKYRDFKDYLKEEAPDIAKNAIEFAETKYIEYNGDAKMEVAIQFVLENLHIPAIYAIMASKVILSAIKSFIQYEFDKIK